MSSLEIRQARENIINYVNKLPFPMEVKRLMFEEILGQIQKASEQEIAAQITERDNQEKKESDGSKEEVETDG